MKIDKAIGVLVLLFQSELNLVHGQDGSNPIIVNEFYVRLSLKNMVNNLAEKYNLDIEDDKDLLYEVGLLTPQTFRNNTLEEVFDQLLQDTDLHFEIDGHRVII